MVLLKNPQHLKIDWWFLGHRLLALYYHGLCSFLDTSLAVQKNHLRHDPSHRAPSEVRIQQRVDAAEQIAAVLSALKRLPQVVSALNSFRSSDITIDSVDDFPMKHRSFSYVRSLDGRRNIQWKHFEMNIRAQRLLFVASLPPAESHGNASKLCVWGCYQHLWNWWFHRD